MQYIQLAIWAAIPVACIAALRYWRRKGTKIDPPHVMEQLIEIRPWLIYGDIVVIILTVLASLSNLFTLGLTAWVPWLFTVVPATGAIMTGIITTLIISSLAGKFSNQSIQVESIPDKPVREIRRSQIHTAQAKINQQLWYSVATVFGYFIIISVAGPVDAVLGAHLRWLSVLIIGLFEIGIPVRNVMTLNLVDEILKEQDVIAESINLSNGIYMAQLEAVKSAVLAGHEMTNTQRRIVRAGKQGNTDKALEPIRMLAAPAKDTIPRRSVRWYVLHIDDNAPMPDVESEEYKRYQKAMDIARRLRKEEEAAHVDDPTFTPSFARGEMGKLMVTEAMAGTIMNALARRVVRSAGRQQVIELAV